jgi:hypothetical protein
LIPFFEAEEILKKNQRLTKDNVKRILLDAGYSEEAASDVETQWIMNELKNVEFSKNWNG